MSHDVLYELTVRIQGDHIRNEATAEENPNHESHEATHSSLVVRVTIKGQADGGAKKVELAQSFTTLVAHL